METFLQLIQAVQSDLTIGDETTLMDVTTVKLAVNRAYRNKVTSIFKWPQTEDAQETSSEANVEYYDYPRYWRPQSIWKLVVDGVDYEDPLAFRDYEYEKNNSYPSGKTKIWANKALKYFISPTPASNGDYNIEIHGHKIPQLLVSDGDLTIFSYNMPELNEAIVLEAKAILKSKGEEDQSAQFASTEAKQICLTSWNTLKREMAKYEKTLPHFNVPDFFGRAGINRNRIGNF